MDAAQHQIALIGGGLGNMATLHELVRDLGRSKHELSRLPSIRVYDIRKDFMIGGEAYAAGSPEMLFTNTFDINEIREKIGKQELLHHLADWLVERKEEWTGRLEALGNSKVDRWLADNRERLEEDRFEEIHLPRVVLSWFLTDLLENTLKKAQRLGISVELIEGEVTDIAKGEDVFSLTLAPGARRVQLTHGEGRQAHLVAGEPFEDRMLAVQDVVLATGLPMRKGFPHLEGVPGFFATHTTQPGDSTPRPQAILETIAQRHRETGRPVRIAGVGLGPSFLDVMMLLDKPELQGTFELVGFSSTGVLRHNSGDKAETTEYHPAFLAEINHNGIFIPRHFPNEDDFFHALDREMERAREHGFGSKDVECIARRYLAAIRDEFLPPRESEKESEAIVRPNFYHHAELHRAVAEKERGRVKLRNHLKQTDPNTAEAAQRMTEQGSLSTIASRLGAQDISAEAEGFSVRTPEGPQAFDIVINCSPREKLRDAPLLDIAIDKGLVTLVHQGNKDLAEIDGANRAKGGLYLGGATVVDYVRDGETITGDVGVGAIMRHAKRISHGIVEGLRDQRREASFGIG